jgi:hypothetical protein
VSERKSICGRCHACRDANETPMQKLTRRMVLCPACGNKRCPQASDCTYACTGSNEPGQVGTATPPEPAAPAEDDEAIVDRLVSAATAKLRTRPIARTAAPLTREDWSDIANGRDAPAPEPDEPACTCGSGAHPRACAKHPEAYAAHVAEIQAEYDAEPDEAHRAAWAWLDTTYQPATADQDAPSLAVLLRAALRKGYDEGIQGRVLQEYVRAAERRGWEQACEEAARECEAERTQHEKALDGLASVRAPADMTDLERYAMSTTRACARRIRALRERGPR